MTTPGEWPFYVARPELRSALSSFCGRPRCGAAAADVAGQHGLALRLRRGSLRAPSSRPCRTSLSRLRSLLCVGRLSSPGRSWPASSLVDFALAFTGAMFLAVAREAARVSELAGVSCVPPLSSVVSVPSARSFDSSRGSCVFLDRLPRVLAIRSSAASRNSRAASSCVSRPRCV